MHVNIDETMCLGTLRIPILWQAKVLSRDNSSEGNEHDTCGHVLGAIPASRVRWSDVLIRFPSSSQAWMRWWAADLQS